MRKMSGVNTIGTVCAGLGVISAIVVHGRAMTRRWRPPGWLLTVGLVLSIPSFLAAVHYLRVLPEMAWLYEMRAWRGFEFLGIFAGLALGTLAARLPRGPGLLVFFAGAGGLMVPYMKPVLAPLDFAAMRDTWDGDRCVQTTVSTCGPASLCTVMRSLGVRAGEREVALACHSYRGGTEAWYLARYARSRGLKAHFIFKDLALAPPVTLPAIVGVGDGLLRTGHFLPVLADSDDKAKLRVLDPLGRDEVVSREDLSRFGTTSFHLCLARGDEDSSQVKD